jgi:HEAT repeat protein
MRAGPTSPPPLSAAETERLSEVDGLLLRGETAIDALIDRLADPSWAVRRAVVSSLASLGDAAARALTAALVQRRDSEARIAATVDALAACTGPTTSDLVAALHGDSAPAVVADVAQILGRRRATAATGTLIALTRHGDDNVAVAAIEALGRVGGRAAIDALVDTVRTGGFFRTVPAIDVLGRSGDPRAVAPLAELLASQHLAAEAARALGRTGERAAVAPLAHLLTGGAALARVAAVALGELELRHGQRLGDGGVIAQSIAQSLRALAEPSMVRRLIDALDDADTAEQVAICRMLSILGGAEATAALSRLLDGDPVVAAAAGRALVSLDEIAERELLIALDEGDAPRRLILLPMVSRSSALPIVLRCLDDEDAGVRAAACDALARIGAPAAVAPVFKLLADSNPRVVQSAVGAIQSLGAADTERLTLEAARAPWPSVRRAALRIVGFFGWPRSLPVVKAALADSDERVREAALQSLPFIDDPVALDELLAVAAGPNNRLRAVATRALGQSRPALRVTAALLRGLADPDPWVRYYACQSLGRLGVDTATPAITRLLDDPAGQVRVAAIEALSHLPGEVAFAALRDAAAAPDPDVRRAALVGLGISRRPEAEPLLIAAMASPDVATRLVALAAVADFGDSEAVVAGLERAAADTQDTVRHAAFGFLAARPGAHATRLLVAALGRRHHVDADDVERIVEALAVPAAGRSEALIASLAQADDEVAPLILSALARARRPDADVAIRAALHGANPAARKAAASVVASRGGDGLAELGRLATGDPDPEVRRVIALLLSR